MKTTQSRGTPRSSARNSYTRSAWRGQRNTPPPPVPPSPRPPAVHLKDMTSVSFIYHKGFYNWCPSVLQQVTLVSKKCEFSDRVTRPEKCERCVWKALVLSQLFDQVSDATLVFRTEVLQGSLALDVQSMRDVLGKKSQKKQGEFSTVHK